MKAGDLVVKRWGRIDPYQQNTIGIVTNPRAITPGLLLTGPLIEVTYPGYRPQMYSPGEFEVVSEGKAEQ